MACTEDAACACGRVGVVLPVWGAPQGWKVVWVPQDSWMEAVAARRQHDRRFDLLLALTLPQGPFTPRLT